MVRPMRSVRSFTKQPDPFAIETGRQISVDTQRLFILDKNSYWANLDQWQKLTLFDSVYHTQELAVGAVNIITRFSNSRMIPQTDNPEVAKRMREIWEEIDGHTVNEMLIRQSLVSGFSIAEWVSEDLETMDKVIVPPSMEIRKIPNQQGEITSYIQLPGFMVGRPTSIDGRRMIPPVKVIDLIRDPLSSFSYYGESLFATCPDQFEAICQYLNASVAVAMRLGKPRFQVTINAEGLSPEQLQDRLDAVKAQFATLGDAESADIYLPSGADIKVIASETLGQKTRDEVQLVVSNILSAVGIPPALMNVTIQASAGGEGYARQSIVAMTTTICEVQRSLAAAWNHSFWNIVAIMEGFPETPRIEFQTPRLLEQSIEETARDLRFKNDVREVVYGIRPLEWLVQRVGANSADDIEALREQIELARAGGMQETENKTSQENTASSNTKVTDERATKNVTI